MSTSEVVQKDHEDLIGLYRRMTPEERLMAFLHHAQLIHQMYQAGLTHRRGPRPPTGREGAAPR